MPDLTGRTVVVTGANSGVGFGAATVFARAGAHIVLAVRDLDRGAAAADRIGGSHEIRRLDLADLASVREFAAQWEGDISILLNNAGIAMVPLSYTVDGFENHLGTNHFGHFALTNLLLPRITDRVVTMSSGLHRRGVLDLDDLEYRRTRYTIAAGYSRSKLANLLFTLELERRLRAAGSTVRATAAHPGYAATNLGTPGRPEFLGTIVRFAGRVMAQTPEQAALPAVFAATQDVPGASYVGPDGRTEMHGYPTLVGRSAAASDVELARKLWEVSEERTGVKFGLT